MYSPRPPPFYPIAPSSSHSTSFASVTDPTLHRQGWQSPRARPEERRVPVRKIPSRYRALLRYDALSASPVLLQEAAARQSNASRPPTATRTPQPPPEDDAEDLGWDDAMISTKKTNLDELKWFQHRWLDKHGKNSHLKESREKMALLRRWFESLDADGSGEVGLDELEDPLVSVGLARSREEVQRLIDQVDKDGSGEVTFTEFLRMMNPEKPKRSRHRQPLHQPKPRPASPEHIEPSATPTTPTSPPSARAAGRTGPGARRQSLAKGGAAVAGSANPVVKLFEDMQSGKLGDLAIPFPVLITAYRRRMLLNAHMSDDPTARRIGTSVLQALESTRYDGPSPHESAHSDERRRSSNKAPSAMSASSYMKSYISTKERRRSTATTGAASTQLPSL